MPVCKSADCDVEFESYHNIQHYCSKRCRSREKTRRYRATDGGRATRARYESSAKSRARYERYRRSAKGKANMARFYSTEKGVMSRARSRVRESLARKLQRLEELGS